MPHETNLADLPVGTRYRHKHRGVFTVGRRTEDTGAKWSPLAQGFGNNLVENIGEIIELGTEPQTILVNPPKPDLDALYLAYNEASIRLAIALGTTVDFFYVDVDGVRTDRWVAPTEIKTVSTGTLVIGEDEAVNEVRSFRLDRIDGQVS